MYLITASLVDTKPEPIKLQKNVVAKCFSFFSINIIVCSPGSRIWKFGFVQHQKLPKFDQLGGGGPRVVVSTAAFHARVRGSVPGLDGLKETKMFLPHPRVKVSIVESLRDQEIACSASDRQGSNFESCV